jgi:hypothetical protein
MDSNALDPSSYHSRFPNPLCGGRRRSREGGRRSLAPVSGRSRVPRLTAGPWHGRRVTPPAPRVPGAGRPLAFGSRTPLACPLMPRPSEGQWQKRPTPPRAPWRGWSFLGLNPGPRRRSRCVVGSWRHADVGKSVVLLLMRPLPTTDLARRRDDAAIGRGLAAWRWLRDRGLSLDDRSGAARHRQ